MKLFESSDYPHVWEKEYIFIPEGLGLPKDRNTKVGKNLHPVAYW